MQSNHDESAKSNEIGRECSSDLEHEHDRFLMIDEAILGLRQALSGKFLSDEELDSLVGLDRNSVKSAPHRPIE